MYSAQKARPTKGKCFSPGPLDFWSSVCRWLTSYLKGCFSSEVRGRTNMREERERPRTDAPRKSLFIRKGDEGFILFTLSLNLLCCCSCFDCSTHTGVVQEEVWDNRRSFSTSFFSGKLILFDSSVDLSEGWRHEVKAWIYACMQQLVDSPWSVCTRR